MPFGWGTKAVRTQQTGSMLVSQPFSEIALAHFTWAKIWDLGATQYGRVSVIAVTSSATGFIDLRFWDGSHQKWIMITRVLADSPLVVYLGEGIKGDYPNQDVEIRQDSGGGAADVVGTIWGYVE